MRLRTKVAVEGIEGKEEALRSRLWWDWRGETRVGGLQEYFESFELPHAKS